MNELLPAFPQFFPFSSSANPLGASAVVDVLLSASHLPFMERGNLKESCVLFFFLHQTWKTHKKSEGILLHARLSV